MQCFLPLPSTALSVDSRSVSELVRVVVFWVLIYTPTFSMGNIQDHEMYSQVEESGLEKARGSSSGKSTSQV